MSLSPGLFLAKYSLDHPNRVLSIITVITLILLAIAVSPNIFTGLQPWIKPLTIDTDPANMLPYDDSDRVFHRKMKQAFNLSDLIVVGIVNEIDPEGVFNPQTLSNIHSLTQDILSIDGVVAHDVLSFATVDDIHNQDDEIVFDWLMSEAPTSLETVENIKQRSLRLPLFQNTLVANNGRAVTIYAAIESKDKSYAIYQQIKSAIDSLNKNPNDTFHIAGLPVAEDVFGVEMFIQMAVVAPLAMLLIFGLLLFFFRHKIVVLSAVIVAFVAVVWTMSTLVISGHTIHIMSSMIPIFIMPIAVLDAIHIHSEFFDRYNNSSNKKDTLLEILNSLHKPMLFTTLTTAVGFASLWLTPIPPVQVFGAFVALGVIVAWLLTITIIPAYLMQLSESSLSGFGAQENQHLMINTWINQHIMKIGKHSYTKARTVFIAIFVLCAGAALGLKYIEVNDNPTKWFDKQHPIRLADTSLNQHIGGTYSAYLTFSAEQNDVFKDPETLRYIENLQNHLASLTMVGKSNSVVDIIKSVHRELFIGEADTFSIPDSPEAVAQLLLIFQNSHRAQDLWKFVNFEFNHLNIWLQMNNGDNQQMNTVINAVDNYINNNPPPQAIKHEWFGLTYINSVWQEKMVNGMLTAFLGSFICVFVMMLLLFRSLFWSLLSMVPLSFSVLIIYGMIGWLGIDYDMPIAVLSSLSLGLSIDYAIHFITRSRQYLSQNQSSWKEVWPIMYAEPARAIFRNILVVGIGFLPLLLSPLVPYNTVGILIATILFLAGFITLWILPTLIVIFSSTEKKTAAL